MIRKSSGSLTVFNKKTICNRDQSDISTIQIESFRTNYESVLRKQNGLDEFTFLSTNKKESNSDNLSSNKETEVNIEEKSNPNEQPEDDLPF